MKPISLLVTTKFAPPRLSSQAVPRDALISRLNEARHHRLVLITGSAGFGKTTVLTHWRMELLKDGATVSWLSLNAEDDAPEVFCAGLIGALQKMGVALEDHVLLLDSKDEDWRQAVCAVLINALDRDNAEKYLMIDDFHHISNPTTLSLIQALVDNAPATFHLMLATRQACPLLLGRTRAMGELCEIDSSELTFTFRESYAFLKSHLNAAIDLETAHSIHDLTNGWPIGLQLLAITLKSKPGNQPGQQLLSSSNLGAYLSEDVVHDLPPELLEFMQKLSILRRFNVELAAHVCDIDNAADMIAMLEARNLFVQPVDLQERYQWYRWHPMFADFLGQRLAESTHDIRQLHLRAAEWFNREALYPEAIRHALLSEDFSNVVQIIQDALPTVSSLSHFGTYMRWIERVPPDLLARRPRLMLISAWIAAITGHLERARELAGTLASSRLSLLQVRYINLLHAVIAILGEDAETALATVRTVGDAPLGHPFFECFRTGVTVGALAYLGRYGEARSEFNAPNARVVHTQDTELALVNRSAFASVAWLEGNMLEAERSCAAILALAEAGYGRRSLSASTIATLMAGILYETDRIDDAREMLTKRLNVLHFSAPEYMYCATVTYARLQCLQESPQAALEYLVKQQAHFRHIGRDHGVVLALAEQVNITLKLGDRRHASSLQATLDDLATPPHGSACCQLSIQSVAALSRARLALASDKPEQALQALEEAHRFGLQLNRGVLLVKADILRALALNELKRDAQAHLSLSTAIASGYRLGLMRTFLDEGEALYELLLNLDEQKEAAVEEYRQQLLRQLAIGVHQSHAKTSMDKNDNPEALLLTKREKEILALVEQTMSNKRIALALNISEQTVKWNLKNIFIKLGVSSRYEAISAARRIAQ
ncbi:AAA family ATPase [Pseudomonas sp. JQ170]|uniref:LuxR C-terminal-related transcriptional regulator n=1 Tax=Pseudomonas sp. JQ170 TaxID=2828861 RepID=UPI00264D7F47|nr:LuxR C-terminal-related transcriptional regulator [Pseudomonas sp. JQ170]MDN7139848.1 AAA family ATPase [Pseudomonas sp. JQ170]